MAIKQSPTTAAVRSVARLARHLDVALAGENLSAPQYRMLLMLQAESEFASALASKLAVTRPTVTALVSGLVSRGLVERDDDPNDRRRVSHSITDKGREAVLRAEAAVLAKLEQLAEGGPSGAAEAGFTGLHAWGQIFEAEFAAHEREQCVD